MRNSCRINQYMIYIFTKITLNTHEIQLNFLKVISLGTPLACTTRPYPSVKLDPRKKNAMHHSATTREVSDDEGKTDNKLRQPSTLNDPFFLSFWITLGSIRTVVVTNTVQMQSKCAYFVDIARGPIRLGRYVLELGQPFTTSDSKLQCRVSNGTPYRLIL